MCPLRVGVAREGLLALRAALAAAAGVAEEVRARALLRLRARRDEAGRVQHLRPHMAQVARLDVTSHQTHGHELWCPTSPSEAASHG